MWRRRWLLQFWNPPRPVQAGFPGVHQRDGLPPWRRCSVAESLLPVAHRVAIKKPHWQAGNQMDSREQRRSDATDRCGNPKSYCPRRCTSLKFPTSAARVGYARWGVRPVRSYAKEVLRGLRLLLAILCLSVYTGRLDSRSLANCNGIVHPFVITHGTNTAWKRMLGGGS